MTNKAYKWIFPARFRSGAYSWKASRLACQRLREAVPEIKKVAKKDPVLGAEGAVRLIEKLWPALEHVDSSSGALGSAVYKALESLIPIIIDASADDATRGKWPERLWQAMEEDGVDYFGPVGDSFLKMAIFCPGEKEPEMGGVGFDFCSSALSTMSCCFSCLRSASLESIAEIS